jgi:hypothetical protein
MMQPSSRSSPYFYSTIIHSHLFAGWSCCCWSESKAEDISFALYFLGTKTVIYFLSTNATNKTHGNDHSFTQFCSFFNYYYFNEYSFYNSSLNLAAQYLQSCNTIQLQNLQRSQLKY